MFLLLSGEGATDIGCCDLGLDRCLDENFKPGPMSWIIDQLIEKFQGYEYSYIENNAIEFLSESFLAANRVRKSAKKMSLPGKKRSKQIGFYYNNARTLAQIANNKAKEINDTVVVIFFRDSDDTASAGRGHWEAKLTSMIKGFEAENFKFGVPMIPKPKSEAWLLCAVKSNSYQSCGNLENESGNDTSPNSLKGKLSTALDGCVSRTELNEMVQDGRIDVDRIDMPSFNVFRKRLKEVVEETIK